MRSLTRTMVFLFISMCFVFSTAWAETLYEEDFESGQMLIGQPNPVWQIVGAVADRVGPGNLFEVIKGGAHSGSYCLRFNYEGRNGICNTCGGTDRYMKSGYSDVQYFVDSEGADLTLDPIRAAIGRVVYNKTDGFSKWQITGISSQDAGNDKLSLSRISSGIDGAENDFDRGDKIKICRECGVDGTVGGDKNRRSDCNLAINYFGNVAQSSGQPLFRRVYLKAAAGSILPYNQKLRYWDTPTGPIYLMVRGTEGSAERRIMVMGPVTGFIDPGFVIQYGVWYYIEEEFKPETSEGASDGEYRLWIAKEGEPVGDPIVAKAGLHLGPVKKYSGCSFWGNHQHWNDCKGYWYIDDVKIATTRIGPIQQGQRPPEAPTNLKVSTNQ